MWKFGLLWNRFPKHLTLERTSIIRSRSIVRKIDTSRTILNKRFSIFYPSIEIHEYDVRVHAELYHFRRNVTELILPDTRYRPTIHKGYSTAMNIFQNPSTFPVRVPHSYYPTKYLPGSCYLFWPCTEVIPLIWPYSKLFHLSDHVPGLYTLVWPKLDLLPLPNHISICSSCPPTRHRVPWYLYLLFQLRIQPCSR